MIESVEIRGLRGIVEGKLEALAKLSILVGPNGSGKSTVLDALLLGADADPGEAIERCVFRRPSVNRPARWLLHRPPNATRHEVVVRTERSKARTCALEYSEKDGTDIIKCSIRRPPGARTFVVTRRFTADARVERDHSVESGRSGEHGEHYGAPDESDPELPKNQAVKSSGAVSQIHLVDASTLTQPRTLPELYSGAVEAGRLPGVVELARSVVSGVRDIRLLIEGGGPVLHLEYADRSLPIGVMGDGMQMLLRLAFELAVSAEGVVLLEEPEVHQHPRVIRESARVIVAAVRRGIQVIFTTHSLELIDAVLNEAQQQALMDEVAVFRTNLNEGMLTTSRLAGADASFSRQQIEDDLR